MHKRSYGILASAAFLTILQGCAWLPQSKLAPVVGSWTNRIGTVWMIKKDGTFDVDLTRGGKRDTWGRYTLEGDTITLTATGGMLPKDCKGDGVYRFQRRGPELSFTLVSDSCELRKRSVLLGWRLRR